MLVLDEPTNDLDTETLELLEERLVDFPGTILLVSHDREFLNNVVTSTIVFENGDVREYVGGYDDWQRQRSEPTAAKGDKPTSAKNKRSRRHLQQGPARQAATGLSRKEKRDLESLPKKTEKPESEIAKLHATMASILLPGDNRRTRSRASKRT